MVSRSRKRRPTGDIRRRQKVSPARFIHEVPNANRTRYLDGRGNLLSSSLELTVAKFLSGIGIAYEYRKELKLKDGGVVYPDFTTQSGIIEVWDNETAEESGIRDKIRLIRENYPQLRVLSVADPAKVAILAELRVPTVALASENVASEGKTAGLFIEDDSLSFDYAHFLPTIKKCSSLHGHSSRLILQIIGVPEDDGVILDFGVAKHMVKEVLADIDHKLVVDRKHVQAGEEGRFDIVFNGPNGEFRLNVPASQTLVLDGDSSVENIANFLVDRVAARMPKNVSAVGIQVFEGLKKGAQFLSHAKAGKRLTETATGIPAP